MKRKLLFACVLLFSIVLISVAVVMIGKTPKKTNDKIPHQEQEKSEIESEELKDDKSLEKESKELLNTLLEDSNYKDLSLMDKKLTNKYDALKSSLIYYYNIYTIKKVYNTLIADSVFYNVKDDDIVIDKEEDKYIYGYISKEKIDNSIKELFGTNEIQFSQKNGWNYLKDGYLSNSTKDNYYHADFLEERNNQYYFKFYGVTGDGTWAYPQPQSIPIKMISGKEYKDYILVTSKAIYTRPNSSEIVNTTRIMDICADTNCNKLLGKISVNSHEKYFPLNIDDYIENAGTIYTIFKKNKNNYYYYKNIIDNI